MELKAQWVTHICSVTFASNNTYYGNVSRDSSSFDYNTSFSFTTDNPTKLTFQNGTVVTATPESRTVQKTYSFDKWQRQKADGSWEDLEAGTTYTVNDTGYTSAIAFKAVFSATDNKYSISGKVIPNIPGTSDPFTVELKKNDDTTVKSVQTTTDQFVYTISDVDANFEGKIVVSKTGYESATVTVNEVVADVTDFNININASQSTVSGTVTTDWYGNSFKVELMKGDVGSGTKVAEKSIDVTTEVEAGKKWKGTYSFENINYGFGANYYIQVSKTGYTTSTSQTFEIKSATTNVEDVNIPILKYTIKGSVSTDYVPNDGKFKVELYDTTLPNPVKSTEVTVSAIGTQVEYSFENAIYYGSALYVKVSHEGGFDIKQSDTATTSDTTNLTVTLANISMQVKSYTLSGVISSSTQDVMVGGATVGFNEKTATTQANGSYSIAGVRYESKAYLTTTATGYKNGQSAEEIEVTQDTTANLTINPITYTIHFEGHGSTSGAMSDMTDLNYDESYNLTKNAFVKENYTFTK